ncbi:MAG: V-type ATP synthase subunit F [Coriobacteriia bacterium]
MSEAATKAKVAVVGDPTTVAGFRPLGFAVFAVEQPAEARGLWEELAGGEYAVVFVTEAVYAALEDLAVEIEGRPVPAVTIIPGTGPVEGLGEKKLTRAIERALGTSTLLGEDV